MSDQVRVLYYHESGDWCRASTGSHALTGKRVPGRIGWVPSAYIAPVNSLEKHTWYHGKISRGEAEYLLSSGINGSFLVRESESCPGQISVSLRYEGRVYHYRLNEDSDGKVFCRYIDGKTCLLIALSCSKERHSFFSYQTVDLSGGGQYGDVYEAYWKRFNRSVAVKTLKEDSMALTEFLSEATIMKDLRHRNLIQLLGRNLILADPFSFAHFGVFFKVSLASLISGERNFVFFRDLAARNCLVGEKHIVKIADFGLARFMREETYTARAGAKFPIKWTAPEGLAYNTFSTKSDVWAFGVLLWEIATYGKTPYPGVEFSEVYTLLEKGFRMECPAGCPPSAYELMLQCWRWSAADRPTFREISIALEEMSSAAGDGSTTVLILSIFNGEVLRSFSAYRPSDRNRGHGSAFNSNVAVVKSTSGSTSSSKSRYLRSKNSSFDERSSSRGGSSSTDRLQEQMMRQVVGHFSTIPKSNKIDAYFESLSEEVPTTTSTSPNLVSIPIARTASSGSGHCVNRESVTNMCKALSGLLSEMKQERTLSSSNCIRLCENLHQFKRVCSAYAERVSPHGKFRFRELLVLVDSHVSCLKNYSSINSTESGEKLLKNIEATVRDVMVLVKR
ncbi:F actin bind and Pkinase Tyr and SH2 domain conta ining protein [Trichuris trichiura]|uniref:Tyrosine-protein kinase n=1 Tax=Trichuris trichiura TaxID=36087 RepID=A0A077YVR2_TRITR|nr:F actin bind and Pkinase Tyr and SH2 domain conta ining protein [Trichuris trichiura]